MTKARLQSLALLAVACAFLALQLALFWGFVVDDAFISYRYAQNLVAGRGLVFNPGERVEGYSNWLWVMLLAGANLSGVDLVAAGRLLGLGSILAVLGLSYGLLARLSPDTSLYPSGLAVLLASSFPVVFFGITGLETIFLAALLLAGAYLFVARGNRLGLGATLCFLAAALARPEGILYFPLAMLVDLAQQRALRRQLVLAIALFAAGYGAFFLWRHSYYGDWFPNTFYAKGTDIPGAWGGLLSGFVDVYHLIAGTGGVVFLLLALTGLLAHRERPGVRLLGALCLGGIIFQLYAGRDWMVGYRLLAPIVPAYLVLGVLGLRVCVEALPGLSGALAPRRTARALLAVFALLGVFGLAEGARFYVGKDRYPNFVMTSEDLLAPSRWVGEHYPAHYRIVCRRIGALAYYSGLELIDDTWGLTDRHVARERFAGRWDDRARDEYLRARNPELIMARAYRHETPPATIQVGGREYRFVKRFRQGEPEWWVLYQRADLPAVQRGSG